MGETSMMMQLTIVYDDVKGSNTNLISDHGFSCLLESSENTVLFDTGTDGNILLHNLKALGKNPLDIDTIIISHEHYDHNGGLPELINILPDTTLYRIKKDMTIDAPQHIVGEMPEQITSNLFTTGKLKGTPRDEHSLILKYKEGIFVLVGCSHSGLENILKVASSFGQITGVMGGFHGFKDFQVLKKIDHIYPAHCTVHKEKILKLYPKQTHQSYLGLTISLP